MTKISADENFFMYRVGWISLTPISLFDCSPIAHVSTSTKYIYLFKRSLWDDNYPVAGYFSIMNLEQIRHHNRPLFLRKVCLFAKSALDTLGKPANTIKKSATRISRSLVWNALIPHDWRWVSLLFKTVYYSSFLCSDDYNSLNLTGNRSHLLCFSHTTQSSGHRITY